MTGVADEESGNVAFVTGAAAIGAGSLVVCVGTRGGADEESGAVALVAGAAVIGAGSLLAFVGTGGAFDDAIFNLEVVAGAVTDGATGSGLTTGAAASGECGVAIMSTRGGGSTRAAKVVAFCFGAGRTTSAIAAVWVSLSVPVVLCWVAGVAPSTNSGGNAGAVVVAGGVMLDVLAVSTGAVALSSAVPGAIEVAPGVVSNPRLVELSSCVAGTEPGGGVSSVCRFIAFRTGSGRS